VPEGHTLHRLAIDHVADLAGRRVRVTSPQGRFAGAGRVDGQVFVGAEAWGKHLFHEYESGDLVHVHLGLYGTFTRHAPMPAPEPRPTCRMRVESTEVVIDLVGATRCAVVSPGERDEVVARLGPDPLRPDADPERAWAALQRRRVPVGQALLDQAVIAGVGNVYRAEVLAAHGIDPMRPSAALRRDEFDAVWRTLVRLMRRGVRENRISGRHVYRQEACGRCGTPVRRWDLAGRWAYACPACQPA
jgi:endonuclease VIII